MGFKKYQHIEKFGKPKDNESEDRLDTLEKFEDM